jgi:hypothetical protein
MSIRPEFCPRKSFFDKPTVLVCHAEVVEAGHNGTTVHYSNNQA